MRLGAIRPIGAATLAMAHIRNWREIMVVRSQPVGFSVARPSQQSGRNHRTVSRRISLIITAFHKFGRAAAGGEFGARGFGRQWPLGAAEDGGDRGGDGAAFGEIDFDPPGRSALGSGLPSSMTVSRRASRNVSGSASAAAVKSPSPTSPRRRQTAPTYADTAGRSRRSCPLGPGGRPAAPSKAARENGRRRRDRR